MTSVVLGRGSKCYELREMLCVRSQRQVIVPGGALHASRGEDDMTTPFRRLLHIRPSLIPLWFRCTSVGRGPVRDAGRSSRTMSTRAQFSVTLIDDWGAGCLRGMLGGACERLDASGLYSQSFLTRSSTGVKLQIYCMPAFCYDATLKGFETWQ